MQKLALSLVCMLPLAAVAQDAFTIKGEIGALNAPAKVYLIYYTPDNVTRIIDSAGITNGAFQFKGRVPETLAWAQLVVKHNGAAALKGNAEDRFPFYLENVAMTITAPDSIKNATIKGSVVNKEEAELYALLTPARDKNGVYQAEYRSKTPEELKDKAYIKRLEAQSNEIDAERSVIYNSFIASHRDSYMGLETFKEHVAGYDIDLGTVEAEFNKFSSRVKASALGKSILARIELAKKTRVGAMATDFTENDPDGKPVRLADLKGKYVLLDFWASWCGPCRMENPNVIAAYNKYKNKNFTVLGISLDAKKDAWLKAIRDDGLTWTQDRKDHRA